MRTHRTSAPFGKRETLARDGRLKRMLGRRSLCEWCETGCEARSVPIFRLFQLLSINSVIAPETALPFESGLKSKSGSALLLQHLVLATSLSVTVKCGRTASTPYLLYSTASRICTQQLPELLPPHDQQQRFANDRETLCLSRALWRDHLCAIRTQRHD